jgi:hypothetical protein
VRRGINALALSMPRSRPEDVAGRGRVQVYLKWCGCQFETVRAPCNALAQKHRSSHFRNLLKVYPVMLGISIEKTILGVYIYMKCICLLKLKRSGCQLSGTSSIQNASTTQPLVCERRYASRIVVAVSETEVPARPGINHGSVEDED